MPMSTGLFPIIVLAFTYQEELRVQIIHHIQLLLLIDTQRPCIGYNFRHTFQGKHRKSKIMEYSSDI